MGRYPKAPPPMLLPLHSRPLRSWSGARRNNNGVSRERRLFCQQSASDKAGTTSKGGFRRRLSQVCRECVLIWPADALVASQLSQLWRSDRHGDQNKLGQIQVELWNVREAAQTSLVWSRIVADDCTVTLRCRRLRGLVATDKFLRAVTLSDVLIHDPPGQFVGSCDDVPASLWSRVEDPFGSVMIEAENMLQSSGDSRVIRLSCFCRKKCDFRVSFGLLAVFSICRQQC